MRLPATTGWWCVQRILALIWFAVLTIAIRAKVQRADVLFRVAGVAGASPVVARFCVVWSERSSCIMAARHPAAVRDALVN